jgi:hypothetical protein
MYAAVFQDAAGTDVYKVRDTAFTLRPAGKDEAVGGALRQFNGALERGQVSSITADSWTQVDVHHGYGRDLVQRTQLQVFGV